MRLLSFEGKLILSDFTEEGFALMKKIHASEGGKHDVGPVRLSDVTEYLITKGLSVYRSASAIQDVLVVSRELV